MIRIALALAALTLPHQIDPEAAKQRAEWNRPVAPFRIVGNVHYVGTAELGAYLITGPKGHILIDGAMAESAPQIAANIRALGFRTQDVRILLNNHAHWDHADGLAALKAMTGAKLLAARADIPALQTGKATDRTDLGGFAPVKVDAPLADGQVVALGPTRITAHLTPGHTPGCTSFTMQVRDPKVEGGRPLNVLMACSLTVAGQKLVGNPLYPRAAADFRASFAKLARVKADVFLNFHTGFFGLTAKRARQQAGDAAAFVDPAETPRQIADARAAFEKDYARQLAAR